MSNIFLVYWFQFFSKSLSSLSLVATVVRVECQFCAVYSPNLGVFERNFLSDVFLGVGGRIFKSKYQMISMFSCNYRKSNIVQGPSWQSVYFKLSLMDRNVQVRFCLKVVLEFWDWIILGIITSFCEMLTVRPLLDQM